MNTAGQRTALINLVTWCEQQLVDLRRRRKMLATGKIRTHEKRDGEYVDTTRDSITSIDQQIAELDRILQDYRRRG